MRTSIELSDSLLARVRKVMAKRKTTLRALVEEGLRRIVEEQPSSPFRLRDGSFKGPLGFAGGAGPEDIPRVLREVNDSRPLP